MHVLVKDVDAWWRHIDSLDLHRQFDVSAAAPPRVEPWGLTVAYGIRSVGGAVALCAGDPRN